MLSIINPVLTLTTKISFPNTQLGHSNLLWINARNHYGAPVEQTPLVKHTSKSKLHSCASRESKQSSNRRPPSFTGRMQDFRRKKRINTLYFYNNSRIEFQHRNTTKSFNKIFESNFVSFHSDF